MVQFGESPYQLSPTFGFAACLDCGQPSLMHDDPVPDLIARHAEAIGITECGCVLPMGSKCPHDRHADDPGRTIMGAIDAIVDPADDIADVIPLRVVK